MEAAIRPVMIITEVQNPIVKYTFSKTDLQNKIIRTHNIGKNVKCSP